MGEKHEEAWGKNRPIIMPEATYSLTKTVLDALRLASGLQGGNGTNGAYTDYSHQNQFSKQSETNPLFGELAITTGNAPAVFHCMKQPVPNYNTTEPANNGINKATKMNQIQKPIQKAYHSSKPAHDKTKSSSKKQQLAKQEEKENNNGGWTLPCLGCYSNQAMNKVVDVAKKGYEKLANIGKELVGGTCRLGPHEVDGAKPSYLVKPFTHATCEPDNEPGVVQRDAEGFIKHVDIGGEGLVFNEVSGICSGFAQSENVNALDHQSYAHWKPIPRLWHLSDWDHPLPFDNDEVCRVTFQNCPLTKTMMEEAARIVKPDGQIDLWVADEQLTRLEELARMVNGVVTNPVPTAGQSFSKRSILVPKIKSYTGGLRHKFAAGTPFARLQNDISRR